MIRDKLQTRDNKAAAEYQCEVWKNTKRKKTQRGKINEWQETRKENGERKQNGDKGTERKNKEQRRKLKGCE